MRLFYVSARIAAQGAIAAVLSLICSVDLCTAAQITSGLTVSADLGYPGQYQITADNQPTSFDATNLPVGLSLNRTTGLITGPPTLSGDYPSKLTAHSQSGDASATCVFSVYTDVPLPDTPLAGLSVEPGPILADPYRPRIYCGNANSLFVIDTVTMSVLKTFPSVEFVIDLAISGDGQTLWITRGRMNSLTSLDLETLDSPTEFPFAGELEDLRVGLENRLYAADPNGDVLQVDATSGVIQSRFTPSAGFLHIWGPSRLAISPDGRTLYVVDIFIPADSVVRRTACSRYDVGGQIPVLLERVEMSAPAVAGLVVTPDGESVYLGLATFELNGESTLHKTISLAAGDLSRTQGIFSYSGTAVGPMSISPDGRQAVQAITRLSQDSHTMTALACVFDTSTFEYLGKVVAGSKNSPAGLGQVYIGATVFDQSGSLLFATTDLYPPLLAYPTPTPSAAPIIPAKSLLNISTRMVAGLQDDVLIGGFIVTGTGSKRVVVRAIGPSLPVSAPLLDPVLELHGPDGALIAENDDWFPHGLDIMETHLVPQNTIESAIIAMLPPGNYTAIVRGFEDTVGVGLVEVYDLEPASGSELANLSSRGRVDTGDNVMIGGFIVGGNESATVAVRALGPSLASAGVSNVLEDPILELHDGNGNLQAENDDWRTGDYQQLIDDGLAPSNESESALSSSLLPGNYTAIVRGKNDSTGVALLEVYNLH